MSFKEDNSFYVGRMEGHDQSTDGKDQLRYHAGRDAITYMDQRTQKGTEQFRRDLNELFFGKR